MKKSRKSLNLNKIKITKLNNPHFVFGGTLGVIDDTLGINCIGILHTSIFNCECKTKTRPIEDQS